MMLGLYSSIYNTAVKGHFYLLFFFLMKENVHDLKPGMDRTIASGDTENKTQYLFKTSHSHFREHSLR